MIEFKPFPKMARLKRQCLITEKIDGTNAQIFITEEPIDEPGPFVTQIDQLKEAA